MVGRFTIRHFCGGFLDEKMTACLNGESEDLFSFWVVYWDVFEVCDDERGVLRKVWA